MTQINFYSNEIKQFYLEYLEIKQLILEIRALIVQHELKRELGIFDLSDKIDLSDIYMYSRSTSSLYQDRYLELSLVSHPNQLDIRQYKESDPNKNLLTQGISLIINIFNEIIIFKMEEVPSVRCFGTYIFTFRFFQYFFLYIKLIPSLKEELLKRKTWILENYS